jgi:hypothetical protein
VRHLDLRQPSLDAQCTEPLAESNCYGAGHPTILCCRLEPTYRQKPTGYATVQREKCSAFFDAAWPPMFYFPGFGYWKHRCPHCRVCYTSTLEARPLILGPGCRKCATCGAVIHDGSREWADLSGSDRRRYFLRSEFLFVPAVLMVPAFALAASIGPSVAVATLVVALAADVVYYIALKRDVKKSLSRKSNRDNSHAHSPVIPKQSTSLQLTTPEDLAQALAEWNKAEPPDS